MRTILNWSWRGQVQGKVCQAQISESLWRSIKSNGCYASNGLSFEFAKGEFCHHRHRSSIKFIQYPNWTFCDENPSIWGPIRTAFCTHALAVHLSFFCDPSHFMQFKLIISFYQLKLVLPLGEACLLMLSPFFCIYIFLSVKEF